MVGDFTVARDVFQAGKLVGEHRREEVLRLHALQGRRHFASATLARQGQRPGRVPAPANRKHRRVQQRLHQQVAHRPAVQVAKDFLERKGMLRAQRKHNGVIGGRGLKLEIEGATESLAQRQPPPAVQPDAERSVDDQLHPAGLVEEPLDHDFVLRRNNSQRVVSRAEIVGELAGGGIAETGFDPEPIHRREGSLGLGDPFLDLGAQLGHSPRQLAGPPRRFAQPEWNAGRLTVSVFDANGAGADPDDSPGRVAELENIARHALDREVLVHGAEERLAGLEHHPVIGIVRNRAAGS